ncbi:cytochrome B561, N terminal-domain-containing protein [Paraphysoderma sedebokerense]|nr:cytochrome B561, N terminal-domain-containing protein [Paraphysoderma sedebokerense]
MYGTPIHSRPDDRHRFGTPMTPSSPQSFYTAVDSPSFSPKSPLAANSRRNLSEFPTSSYPPNRFPSTPATYAPTFSSDLISDEPPTSSLSPSTLRPRPVSPPSGRGTSEKAVHTSPGVQRFTHPALVELSDASRRKSQLKIKSYYNSLLLLALTLLWLFKNYIQRYLASEVLYPYLIYIYYSFLSIACYNLIDAWIRISAVSNSELIKVIPNLNPKQRKLFHVDPRKAVLIDAIVKPKSDERSTVPPRPLRNSPLKSQMSPLTTPKFETPSNVNHWTPSSRGFPSPRSPLSPNTTVYYSPSQSPRSPETPSIIRHLESSRILDDEEPIYNAKSLRKLLKSTEDAEAEQWSQLQAMSKYGPSLSAQTSQRPIFQTYQPASRARPSFTQGAVKVDQEGLRYCSPLEVAQLLRIEDVLDDWGENMRLWISETVVKPLSDRIVRMEKKLEEEGLSHLSVKLASWSQGLSLSGQTQPQPSQPAQTLFGPKSSFSFGTSGQAGGLFGTQQTQKPMHLVDLANRFSHISWVQERIILERFLNISSYPNAREYLYYRIHELAQGARLSHYVWNRGGQWGVDTSGNKREWTSDLPSDAEVIVHLFCVYLDSIMPGENPLWAGHQAFSSKFFVGVEARPDQRSKIQIKQKSKSPSPHFCLVVEKTYWDMFPKRSNAFLTLALFVYYVNKKMGGYIGLLHLSSKGLGLQKIFE